MNDWDKHAKTVRLNGRDTQMFTRGALARALNRQVVTIRSWERKGILPRSFLRDESTGRWYYTRSQIEALVDLAEREGVLDPKLHDWPAESKLRFREEAQRILSRF